MRTIAAFVLAASLLSLDCQQASAPKNAAAEQLIKSYYAA